MASPQVHPSPQPQLKQIKIKPKSQPQPLEAPQSLNQRDSVYYIHTSQRSNKLAMFDLDGTLIKTLSGHKFPQSETDWQLTYSNVSHLLRTYIDNRYKLIVFSNQYKTDMTLFEKKLIAFQNAVNLPIEFYISTDKDSYRKPMTDMWDLMLELNQLTPNLVDHESFYCGDAAGRPGDFNITDRYFAYNIGLGFYTPEELFLNADPLPYKDPYQSELHLDQFVSHEPYPLHVQTSVKQKNVVLMVGPQASGKSSLIQNEAFANYLYLNNDTIKNLTQLKKLFTEAIKNGQSVIVDNTNPSLETREYYFTSAKQNGYNIYCYFFDFPKVLACHLNQMRVQMSHGHQRAIPMVAIHTYYKKLVKPELSEGFDQIITLKHIYQPLSLKYYYYHYNLSD